MTYRGSSEHTNEFTKMVKMDGQFAKIDCKSENSYAEYFTCQTHM